MCTIAMAVWIHFAYWICGFFAVSSGQMERGLLQLTNGSSQHFDALWADPASYNDPYGNKSEVGPYDQSGPPGDFKSVIDPAWGNATQIYMYLYNDVGDVLAEFSYDVIGANISLLSDWFIPANLFFMWPHTQPNSMNFTIRDGVREMVMTDNSSGDALFAITHQNTWPTALLLAANSALINSSAGGVLYNMIPPTSATVLNVTDPGPLTFLEITSETWSWVDAFFYMDGISVNALGVDDNYVNYTFVYSDDVNVTYEYAFPEQFTSNGSLGSVPTLLVSYLKIVFNVSVDGVSVTLFGPPADSFVVVSRLYVTGLFSNTSSTSTTSSSTSTTTTTTTTTTPSSPTPTTSPISSTTPSLSILINGTLYCPCTNATVSNTTTGNLTLDEIVDGLIANLTLDKDTLSSTIRRYNSADDDRPSAQAFGAFAIFTISLVVGVVVLCDSPRLVNEVSKLPKSLKKWKQKQRLPGRSTQVDDISTQKSNADTRPTGQTHSSGPGFKRSATLPDIAM